MRLKVSLHRDRPATSTDLTVDVDGTVTVGALADIIATADPVASGPRFDHPTITTDGVDRRAVVLDRGLSILESDLGSGQSVRLVPVPKGAGSAAVTLVVQSGPDAGKRFDLARGVATIGRDRASTVRLDDPQVSQRHARLIVGDKVEIVDEGSTNGILVGGDQVQRVELRRGDVAVLGDTAISVELRHGGSAQHEGDPGTVAFNRSPRLDPQYEGQELEAPELPTPATPAHFPLITAIAPLFMGGVLYAITQNIMSILFVALSPMMIVGGYFENKRQAKRALRVGIEVFRQNLAELVVELRRSQDAERRGRCAEHPSTVEVVEAVRTLSPLVWTRRPEHEPFSTLRLGLGRQPSRTTVEMPSSRNSLVELQHELRDAVAPYAMVEHVPIVAQFRQCGSLGVSGPDDIRSSVARAIVAQLVSLHAPGEVVLCAMASARTAAEWDWLKWLPHVSSDHSPIAGPHLATTAPACTALVAELEEVVQQRAAAQVGQDAAVPLPALFVLVEDDAPLPRPGLVRVLEAGREVGVHAIWMAPTTARVPAAARTFVELDLNTGAATGKVIEAEHVQPVVIEPLDRAGAEWLARRLSPVIDAGAQVDRAQDVPVTVSFLEEVGSDLADDPGSVVERWRESNSLPDDDGRRRRVKRDNTLRAFVGRSALDRLHLDLRTQGPHALVGGTTGAGKSEFLQTWILGMASAHSPQRVTFLFIDYKGGSAFADCVNLPHSVGLVTDLSPHLVQRALVSLNAELRYREHVLNRKKAKDLLELERRGDPEVPPSLVIIVDEFAALVQEVPEFVDGVVNVAQRGRSLGLHLILATQRPAGVIKDNLRANTNLRVALRMADEEDSKDVVGTTTAGTFDPGVPGRAIVKSGPGRLTLFQAGYVGGWTSDEPPPPKVGIATLGLGTPEEWDTDVAPTGTDDTVDKPTDIHRVVDNLRAANRLVGLEPPRRPWLPELAHAYDLAALPLPRRDAELVFGVVDRPEHQDQGLVSFRPDIDGNIAVFGTGGSGKSSFLRTLAISAGLTARGGPCFVYALDHGSRGLSMLEALPNVGAVIGAEDTERTARLISKLRADVDERAQRYAAVNAATIDEYRRISGTTDEPRILLLVDGFAAFRSAYEAGPSVRIYDQLVAIAGDGRPVGVHVVLSSDRLGSLPPALSASIQRKIALRLSSEMDEAMLDVPRDGFGENPPAGRGFLGGVEIQVAVLGGSPDVASQAQAVHALAESMSRSGAAGAPPIERLSDQISLADLPPVVDGLPTFAMADDSLAAIGFEPSGTVLVTGPAHSGRTTAVRAMVASLRAMRPTTEVTYIGLARSPLAQEAWARAAIGPSEAAAVAQELTETWAVGGGDGPPRVLVLDGLGEFVNSEADFALQDLLKVCRTNGTLVIADGETSDVTGSWPLLQTIKAARHGLVLQPDQTDGDQLFRTTFGRMSRAEFPAGRGMYVRSGRARRVQVALPGPVDRTP